MSLPLGLLAGGGDRLPSAPGGQQQRYSQPGRCVRPCRRRAARVPLLVAAWGGFGRAPPPLEPGRLFVFGLGYSGLGAANYFLQRGWSVAGTCRSEDKCARLAERGIEAFHWDPQEFDTLGGRAQDALRGASHVLSTVPPDDDAHSGEPDPVVFSHAQALSEGAERYAWVGYVSSTSVYGDWQGEWVGEASELRATGGKGWSRVLAEHEWLALQTNFGLPVHVFRCGGIYGPRRSALEALQRGGGASAERRARQRYTARCHVYDICRTLEASMRHPRPGAAYNIADDDPAPRAEVLDFAAELLQRRRAGLPLAVGPGGGPGGEWALPGAGMRDTGATTASGSTDSYDSGDDGGGVLLAAGALRPRARMRRGEARQAAGVAAAVREALAEKRVSNQRIKTELGVRMQFPTYREGLAAIAAGDMRPFD